MGAETPITDRTASTVSSPYSPPPPPERIGAEGLSYIIAGLRLGPRVTAMRVASVLGISLVAAYRYIMRYNINNNYIMPINKSSASKLSTRFRFKRRYRSKTMTKLKYIKRKSYAKNRMYRKYRGPKKY